LYDHIVLWEVVDNWTRRKQHEVRRCWGPYALCSFNHGQRLSRRPNWCWHRTDLFNRQVRPYLYIRIARLPGRDYELTCISSNMQTQCSATQGVVFGEGNCDQADIENMFQKDGYCQPRTFLHGAKVFCEDDDMTVTSVAYNLANWGNCKKQNIDCSAGPLQYLYINYCCEKI
jgi:hypothetical protein